MNIDSLQFCQMLQFFELGELNNKIAMNVERLEVRKRLEVVVKRCEVIMRDVNPLKIADIVHNRSKDSVQP